MSSARFVWPIVALCVVCGVCGAAVSLGAQASNPRPDPALTPGAVVTVDAAVVCARGYATARRHADSLTIARLRNSVYRRYAVPPHTHHQFDHLIPLELGGASTRANLWPEPATGVHPAAEKDRLENAMHRLVCLGRWPLATAQRQMAADWIALATTIATQHPALWRESAP